MNMQTYRKCKKIRRYVHRKIGFWNIKKYVKYFFDMDNETIEELKERLQKEWVISNLQFIVENFVTGRNSYDQKIELAKPEYNQWIKKYIENIFLITEDDIDLIFCTIKQI